MINSTVNTKLEVVAILVGQALLYISYMSNFRTYQYYMMCALSFCVLLGFIKRVTIVAWKESLSETILGQIKGSDMTLDEFVSLTPLASFKFGAFIDGCFIPMTASDVQGKKDLAV